MRFLSVLSFTLLLSAPAFAADLGMYRPGTPYQSVVAPGADVCDSHCAGDAQCRGWNYVKANPRAPGVCEFISSVSTPVPSQISISGLGVGSAPASSKLMTGGSNTVRVGTAPAPKPRSSTVRVGNRKIVREAVPQQARAQTASTRRVVKPANSALAGESLTAQQNRYRQRTGDVAPQSRQQLRQQPRQQQRQATAPAQRQFRPEGRPQARPQQAPQQRFRPMLDGQQALQSRQQQMPQNRQMQRPNPQYQQQGMVNPQSRPQSRPQTQQRRAPARRRGAARPEVGVPIQPQQQFRPQNQTQTQQRPQAQRPHMRPQAHGQNMPRSSAQAPVTHQNGEAALKQRQAQLIAQANKANTPANYQGLTAAQAQQSLYGSLNDDVKVPASNRAAPTDPNAPIATAASRPSTPVKTEPLEGLAGAPR